MEVIIKQIHRSDKAKDGKPFMTKDNRPYTRVGIITDKHGDKTWLSGFEGRETSACVVGSKVVIEVTKNGEYTNFKVLSETDKMWKAINDILMRLVRVETDLRRQMSGPEINTKVNHVEEQTDEIDPNNLPF